VYQGNLHLPDRISVPSEYSDMHLLAVCLLPDRALVMSNLDANLTGTALSYRKAMAPGDSLMLPAAYDVSSHVRGLLVTASRHQRELDHKDDAAADARQLPVCRRPTATGWAGPQQQQTASSTSAVADITRPAGSISVLIGESDGMESTVYSLSAMVLHNPGHRIDLPDENQATGKETSSPLLSTITACAGSKPYCLNVAGHCGKICWKASCSVIAKALSAAHDSDHSGYSDAADGGHPVSG